MFCRKCGVGNDDNAFRCVKCHAIVQDLAEAMPPLHVEVSTKTNPVVLVVMILGGGLMIMCMISIVIILSLSMLGGNVDGTLEYDADTARRVGGEPSRIVLRHEEHPLIKG